jgi:hypothetical protein
MRSSAATGLAVSQRSDAALPWWRLTRASGTDRRRLLRGYLFDCLARQRLDGDLALAFAQRANQSLCDPPMESTEVTRLAEAVAKRVVQFEARQ